MEKEYYTYPDIRLLAVALRYFWLQGIYSLKWFKNRCFNSCWFFICFCFYFTYIARNLKEAVSQLVQWLNDIHKDMGPLYPFT